MHVTKLSCKSKDWNVAGVSSNQLFKVICEVKERFTFAKGNVVFVQNGYGSADYFYKPKGSYNLFNTCNTWVDNVLKNSSLKQVCGLLLIFRYLVSIKNEL
ncbi:hypothetical protein NBRC110019_31660 [Neptunitalea chrysea]|uniref:DUF2459 domain-containing protein n=1 Tax=Neptunitalea chrysea TaxID=1647581 RepID=A0A9W6EUZ9_9FLAO|nr:hypothetical protein NBRC110019_31660 [Neptunitalea chrysea]